MSNSIQINLGGYSTTYANAFTQALTIPGGTLKIDENTSARETLNSISDTLLSTLMTGVDGTIAAVEGTAQAGIKNGVEAIYDKLGVNKENLELANQVVSMAGGALAKVSSILSIIPTNIYLVPSTSKAITSIVASYKEIIMATYMQVKSLYEETRQAFITNTPSTLEILVAALKVIIDQMYELIDREVYEYTGMHIEEIYKKVCVGIDKYKAWKQARKEKKAQAAKDDENNSSTTNISASGSSKKLNVNVNTDKLKDNMMNWLAALSDTLFNCFIIIQLRDAITDIQYIFSQLTNCSLTVLADTINSVDDLIELLQELGCDDDSNIITLDEAKEGLINIAGGALSSLKDSLQSSISVNADISTEKTFDISTDVDTRTITITFYQNPTKSKISKKVYNVLAKAKNNDTEKSKVFNESELSQVRTMINDLVEEGNTTATQLIGKYIFSINLKYDVAAEKEAEEKAKEDKTTTTTTTPAPGPDVNAYNLGVVTEEYSYDPTQTTKRKTLELIHVIFSLFKDIAPYLSIFATLVSNYNTNKELVRSNSARNLLAQFISNAIERGLNKLVDTDSLNFYTVRTLELYDYTKKEFLGDDFSGVDALLDNGQTQTLISWLQKNNQPYNSLNEDYSTTLYIDLNAIKQLQDALDENSKRAHSLFGDDASLFITYPNTAYVNGTTTGLSGIEDTGLGIFYSDSSLSMYSSLIWDAYSKSLDPSI